MTILDAAKRRFGENVKGIKDVTPYPHRECQGWCCYEISFVNKSPMLIKGNVFINGGLYVFYTKEDAKDFACAYIEHMLKKTYKEGTWAIKDIRYSICPRYDSVDFVLVLGEKEEFFCTFMPFELGTGKFPAITFVNNYGSTDVSINEKRHLPYVIDESLLIGCGAVCVDFSKYEKKLEKERKEHEQLVKEECQKAPDIDFDDFYSDCYDKSKF